MEPERATTCEACDVKDFKLNGRWCDWFERHVRLGGWVGAVGAIAAIFAAWLLAQAEYLGAQRLEDGRVNAQISLIGNTASQFDSLVQQYNVVEWFYDKAVRGADAITERPGFAAMLDRIAGNGVRTIIVESPDRFARDLAVQLAGHDHLRKLGVTLIPTTAPDFFAEDTPTAVLVLQDRWYFSGGVDGDLTVSYSSLDGETGDGFVGSPRDVLAE